MASKASDTSNLPVSEETEERVKGENVEPSETAATTGTNLNNTTSDSRKQIVYKKIAQYSLIKEIGYGSFARVYKARTEKNGVIEEFAIKMIAKQHLREENQELIDKEINILLKLNHPNIIKLKDFKKTTNNWYLVFEFCEQGDLEKYMRDKLKGCFPLHMTLIFIQQLASAFKEIRRLKIVHRDLKLANILLTKNLEVKLGDFGFAKHFEENSLLQSYCGTPITMAPEILKREKYNEKCDIWSLGVIFYQMIYGVAPFQPPKRASVSDLIYLIDKQEIKFEGAVITPEIKDLITKMLVPNIAQRMSFEEFFDHPVVQQDYFQSLPKDMQEFFLVKKQDGINLEQKKKQLESEEKQNNPQDTQVREEDQKVKEDVNINKQPATQNYNQVSEQGMLEMKEKQNWALEHILSRMYSILEEEADRFAKNLNEYRDIADQMTKDKNTEFGESCAWSALLLLLLQTVKTLECRIEIKLNILSESEQFGVPLPQSISQKLKDLCRQLNDQIHSMNSFNIEMAKQSDACTMLFGNLLHYADYYLLNEFLNPPQVQIKYYKRCMKFCELLQSLKLSVFSSIQISLFDDSIGITKQDIQKILQIPPLPERVESTAIKPKRKMSTLKQLVEIEQLAHNCSFIDTLNIQDKQEDIQTQYEIYQSRYESCLALMKNTENQ